MVIRNYNSEKKKQTKNIFYWLVKKHHKIHTYKTASNKHLKKFLIDYSLMNPQQHYKTTIKKVVTAEKLLKIRCPYKLELSTNDNEEFQVPEWTC